MRGGKPITADVCGQGSHGVHWLEVSVWSQVYDFLVVGRPWARCWFKCFV